MEQNSITPSTQIRKGAHLLQEGISLVFTSLMRIINRSVHHYPYAYIIPILFVSLVLNFVSIAKARAERDNALHEQAKLQQQLDTLKCFTLNDNDNK